MTQSFAISFIHLDIAIQPLDYILISTGRGAQESFMVKYEGSLKMLHVLYTCNHIRLDLRVGIEIDLYFRDIMSHHWV